MDSDSLRRYGCEMVHFVANYWDSLDNGERMPLPDVKPGYIRALIPDEPPKTAEEWEKIFADIEPVVLRGNTHWHHPNFFAYYSTACSYAGVIGDILSGGIASIGFTWKSSPAMTELEQSMLDWLAKAIGLPSAFWNSDPGPGIGMIQSTASDATLIALLSARARAVEKMKRNSSIVAIPQVLRDPIAKAMNRLNGMGQSLRNSIRTNGNALTRMFGVAMKEEENYGKIGQLTTFEAHDSVYFSRLVAYCSDQSHSSVLKGIMLSGVKVRNLPTFKENGGNFVLKSEVLEAAIKEDRARGLTPFILVATIGTTNTCAIESCRELGPICSREGIWLHVDAAYAGSFLICEEFRYLSDGVEFADSFNFNAHKALMINFDCSPMWFKNGDEAIAFFNVDPVYLQHEHQRDAYDFRHLQVALGRRFRALKIWFVFRAIGIQRIQQFLRMQNDLAKTFADLLLRDDRFELFVPQNLGLCCFRLKTSNKLNEALCVAINEDRRVHLVASSTHGTFFLRFVVCSSKTRETNIEMAVKVIVEMANKVLGMEESRGG
uniref:Aromatic-L-amino-acid decarboxylase n=1 Tax=Globodera pallida TaxID=36090 RepID=A0A183BY25_GLOPA